jgi:ubiquinone/menaquinone biosynthesis C-methylase UbiE
VYGPETWEIYDRLDESLDPRGPEALLALAVKLMTAASVVLDVGCRDAAHLIELVRTTGASGVGLDPVTRLVEQARAAVRDAGLEGRVQIIEGVMQEMPFPRCVL